MHFQLAGSGVMSAFYPHESELSRRVKQLIRAAKKQLEALGKLRVELEAAEKRIAELEAREISLPERSSMLHRTDFHDDYQTVMAYKVSEVIDAIRATGIRIKGE